MSSVSDLIKSFKNQERQCINLIASENILCESSRKVLQSCLYTRYCFDSDEVFFFPGREKLQQINDKCKEMLKDKLNAKYINLKPISGLNCMTLIISFARKGCQCFLSLNPKDGGHGVTSVIAKEFGLNVQFINFNRNSMDIDYNHLDSIIGSQNMRKVVMYIDHMNVLFPIDVNKIRERYPKILIIYDVSHLLGLIVGKAFMNPLEKGADIIIGSTHKTFPGPHKGIIATNNLLLDKKVKYYSEVFVSHEHIADIAALALALENNQETLEIYAHKIVDYSFRFANALHRYGVKVLFPEKGFTKTHQIWIDAGDTKEEVHKIVSRLASYGLIVNSIVIPVIEKWGIRIGVNEIAQKLSPEEVEQLAYYFALVFNGTIKEEQCAELYEFIKLYNEKVSILQ